MQRIKLRLAAAVIGSALTTLAGCATFTSQSAATKGAGAISCEAANPIPRVQDCGVLNTGTPSHFVCGGKVCTSFQLAKLREHEAKK